MGAESSYHQRSTGDLCGVWHPCWSQTTVLGRGHLGQYWPLRALFCSTCPPCLAPWAVAPASLRWAKWPDVWAGKVGRVLQHAWRTGGSVEKHAFRTRWVDGVVQAWLSSQGTLSCHLGLQGSSREVNKWGPRFVGGQAGESRDPLSQHSVYLTGTPIVQSSFLCKNRTETRVGAPTTSWASPLQWGEPNTPSLELCNCSAPGSFRLLFTFWKRSEKWPVSEDCQASAPHWGHRSPSRQHRPCPPTAALPPHTSAMPEEPLCWFLKFCFLHNNSAHLLFSAILCLCCYYD